MSNVNVSGGVGLDVILFIVFLVLKLTETISWSWWWVTSPLWIPIAFGMVCLIIAGLFGLLD